MCLYIWQVWLCVHIYITGLRVCTYIWKIWVCAHIYDKLAYVHIYLEGLSMCTCIWYVWVCVQIHMAGLSMCAHIYIWKVCTCAHIYSRFVYVCTCVTAPVTPSKDHVPCYMEMLLTVLVWFGLKMCTVAALPRGKKPWAPQSRPTPGLGKALKTPPLTLQAGLGRTRGSGCGQCLCKRNSGNHQNDWDWISRTGTLLSVHFILLSFHSNTTGCCCHQSCCKRRVSSRGTISAPGRSSWRWCPENSFDLVLKHQWQTELRHTLRYCPGTQVQFLLTNTARDGCNQGHTWGTINSSFIFHSFHV